MGEPTKNNSSFMGFFRDLVKNNSGLSSKSFFLVLITLLGCMLLAVVGFVLIWEVLQSGTIKTDLNGLSLVIGSITAIFGTAGATKYFGEKNEKKDDNGNS